LDSVLELCSKKAKRTLQANGKMKIKKCKGEKGLASECTANSHEHEQPLQHAPGMVVSRSATLPLLQSHRERCKIARTLDTISIATRRFTPQEVSKGYRGTSLIRIAPPVGPYSNLMQGTYGGPMGLGVSYQRGTPVQHAPRTYPLSATPAGHPLQGYLAHKKLPSVRTRQ